LVTIQDKYIIFSNKDRKNVDVRNVGKDIMFGDNHGPNQHAHNNKRNRINKFDDEKRREYHFLPSMFYAND
jgi:hypothetical protein